MSDRVADFIDAAVNDHEAAKRMLRETPELLEARYLHQETPLHFLAVEGYAEGVRFLAESGADLEATNRFGDTALLDAIVLGRVQVVETLLQYGADPNAGSPTRDNPVHAAAGSGDPRMLDLVLAAGGRTDYITDLGETVWSAVARHPRRRTQMESVLKKHRATPPD